MDFLKSIRGRLMASVLLLSAVAAGIGALGLIKAANLRDRMDEIAGPIAGRARLTDEVDINLINFIRMQKNVILSADSKQRENFKQQQRGYSAAFDKALDDWEPIASELGKQDIRDIRTAFDEYKQMNSQALQLVDAGHPDQAQALSVSKSFEIFARIRKPLDASKKRSADELARQKEETATLFRHLCWSMGITIVLGVGFGLGMAWYVVSETVLRLNKLRDYVRDVAEGEGDLTRRIKIVHEDELGEVGIWINNFLAGIEEIIAHVAENTARIADSAGQIANSAESIADSSQSQDSKASEVSNSMRDMASSVAEVSMHSEQAALTAQQAGEAAQSGSQTVDNTVAIMREIASSAHQSSETIQQLDQSSDEIGRIVAVINEIASQTSLLALNAAIEAARAGEQGRGFAVVAGEVRRLADRTTQATKEIGSMIGNVQQTTHQAVEVMDESTRKVAHGMEVVQQCSTALGQITARAGDVQDMISQIAAAATEQAAATREVNTSMDSIATMVRDSSSSAQASAEACQQLSRLAGDLKQLVGRFKASPRPDRRPEKTASPPGEAVSVFASPHSRLYTEYIMSEFLPVDEQLDLLQKGAAEIIRVSDLRERLEESRKTGRPLRIKAGFDPTSPDLHLGHTVLMRKLRHFQQLGHTVIFLVGDFTSLIGDPTGRNVTRKPLTREQIDKNAETYKEQVFKILDADKTEVRYNSEWLGKLDYEQTIRLTAHFTVSQMLERDDFHKRYNAEQPISLHEFLYPVMQGYDSVCLECDVELGGTAQKFNLLCGRELQRHYGQKPQIVLMTPILEGLDGVQKMSKSLGNCIGIAEPASEMYGKLMSINDELMWKYWIYLTDLKQSEIDQMRSDVAAGTLHPMTVKKQLARTIVAGFHSEAAATEADENWARMFQQKEVAENLEEVNVSVADIAGANPGEVRLPKLLVALGLAASGAEANRKIAEKAVKLDGETAAGNSFAVGALPAKVNVRLGKRAKIAVIA